MTATFLGPEVIVDAVVAKLRTEMPTRVAAINAEKDDDITIAAPEDSRYFTAMLRLIAPGGPAVLVMDGRMAREGRGEGPHSLSTVTQIGVWVMDEDADEQRLGRRLQRLARAVIESLWDGDPKEQLAAEDGTQVAWELKPEGTVPGDPFEPEGGGPGLREFYLVVFTVKRLED